MNVLIVQSDEGDWQGLYVDGKLKCEGHSLDARTMLEAVNIKPEFRIAKMDPYEMSSLPATARELYDAMNWKW